MAAPWEKYAPPAADAPAAGPWDNYAPASAQDFTANPGGQGTYKMTGADGKQVGIPYGNVVSAHAQGYKLDPSDEARFTKDYAAAQPAGPGVMKTIGSGALNFGKGAIKGALSTVANTDDMVSKIPYIGNWLTTPLTGNESSEQARANEHAKATPHGTMQKIGKGAEQAGEFFVPGLGEDAVASKIPTLLEGATEAAPKLMKLGKIGVTAVGSGLVNKAQGGGFTSGAVMGGLGDSAAQGIKAMASPLAETALGVRATDRIPEINLDEAAAKRSPGQAILAETTGVRPGSIANQSFKKIGALTDTLDDAAREAEGPAYMGPARETAHSWNDSALRRNEPSAIKKTGNVIDQVSEWSGVPGEGNRTPIPSEVTPYQMLTLRRGMGDVPRSWNPATTTDFSSRAAKAVYRDLGDEVSRTVPGADELDNRISSLMPVARRAGATDLNAGVTQRIFGRLARPTGALAGAAIGGDMGYQKDGLRGAVLGGVAGLIAPEIFSSPTTLMMAARAADSPALAHIVPAVSAAVPSVIRAATPTPSPFSTPDMTYQDQEVFPADPATGVKALRWPTLTP